MRIYFGVSIYTVVLVMVIITLGGCALTGIRLVHSPSAHGATPLRHRHVHGGDSEKSPPGALYLSARNGLLSLELTARPLVEKRRWGGILFPIVPLFWLPKQNYYKNEPSSLHLYLFFIGEHEIEINSDSLILVAGDMAFTPSNIEWDGREHPTGSVVVEPWLNGIPYPYIQDHPGAVRLTYPLSAHDTNEFRLALNGILCNQQRVDLPTVRFKKAKQKWHFLGP